MDIMLLVTLMITCGLVNGESLINVAKLTQRMEELGRDALGKDYIQVRTVNSVYCKMHSNIDLVLLKMSSECGLAYVVDRPSYKIYKHVLHLSQDPRARGGW